MLKSYLSIFLISLLAFGTSVSSAVAQTPAYAAAENIKAALLKRGVNEKKRVRVKMQDGTKIKGYISQIGDDSFTLANSKTKQPVVIAYRDVSKVESGGLAGGARVGIIVGAAAGAALIVIYLAFQNAIENN